MLNLKISQFSIIERTSLVSFYLNEVSQYSLVNPEKEIELIQKAQKGDIKSRNELICANLRFVISVANEHKKKHPSSELSDLINAGNLGLIKAIEKFDETRGFKLITYAVSWIKQSMIDFSYRQDRVVSLPYNAVDMINKIKNATSSFESKNHRSPTLDEISEITGKSFKSILSAFEYSIPAYSLDNEYFEGENLYGILENKDSPSPFYDLERMSMNQNVYRLLSILSDIQKEVITQIFGIGCQSKTIGEIAFELGLPRRTIENIKTVAFSKIRKYSSSKKIKNQTLLNC